MPLPLVPIMIAALVAAAASAASKKKKAPAAPSTPLRSFVNGMPADRGLPSDTFDAVNVALVQPPDDPQGPATYQLLVNALLQMSALLRQNYPLAADALTARWIVLRGQALANGWRERDALDGPQV